ncbi:MAG: hypothetical protein WCK35_06285, partial [Chloroflexota bacterium]
NIPQVNPEKNDPILYFLQGMLCIFPPDFSGYKQNREPACTCWHANQLIESHYYQKSPPQPSGGFFDK